MKTVTYHGTEPADQPTVQLSWEPGDTKELDDELAARLCTPGALFTGPELGAAAAAPAAAPAAPSVEPLPQPVEPLPQPAPAAPAAPTPPTPEQ